MPPKQPPSSSSKAAVDKTFGMKNKKGGKVQRQVQMMQKQASTAGKSKETLAKEREREIKAKEKAEEEKRKKENAELFKPVQTQKVPFGVDPKTILCAFYKAGNCEKGTRCKFSHDMNVGRKVDKKDLYSDTRDENDTMDKWDEEKLRTVVLSKAGNPRTTTDIVCKYFIEAIESRRYGWFWQCPNEIKGDNCQYRHALPPGFVLKSEKKAKEEAEKANIISIEEFLETARHKLGSNLTPVTPESFAKWKQNRQNKKEAEAEALKKVKDTQAAAGKSSGMSGRDLFQYNPEWFEDEDEGGKTYFLDQPKPRLKCPRRRLGFG
ncbi:hypothetical protein K439DRAFT_1611490 [Ramaria rubella]|nr:hypothetical protein K439DRAFT_1611490 [Ramaria rubella]